MILGIALGTGGFEMSATDALKYVPAPLVAWAFIVLVIVFTVFAGIAIFAWTQDESITLFDMGFGKTKLGLEGSTAALPSSGAVIAFDRPGGCPTGWSDFKDAAGKVIIGVGEGSLKEKLASRKYRAEGGEEKHKLTSLETPKHVHYLNIKSEEFRIAKGRDKRNLMVPDKTTGEATKSAGAGKHHNNMPPYIALYFCKKEPA